MAPTAAVAPSTEFPPGHVGNLTDAQRDMLKKVWLRLFELFEQKGTPYTPQPPKVQEEAPKKSGWFGKKAVKEDTTTELFFGTTSNPEWMTLPLEKALPLIPGDALKKTFWSMVATDNPDAVILRFCRARKWELDAAYNMLTNALRWRIANRLDDIVALGETGLRDELNNLKAGMGDSFIQQLGSGKAYLGGPDKDGRGICFINVCLHFKEDQAPEVVKLLTLYVMETSRFIVHQPVESNCIVFNMDNFTLKNMDFDFIKFLVTCFEAYYPETLGSCLIHRAPWVFSTVWNLITPLLDPVVASKIHFTKNLDELVNYVDVSALPGNISGEKGKLTLDEAVKTEPVAPGTLTPPTSEKFQEYQETIKEYTAETTEWAKSPSAEGSDAIRRELAKQYRHARLHAELDIRGPTSYQAKGLITIENDRVFLNFGNDGWTPLDITDMV